MILGQLNLMELKAILPQSENDYGNELLSWFADQEKTEIYSDDFNFYGKKIFRYRACLGENKSLSGFGRSQDERLSAVKACAEAIERKIFLELISERNLLNLNLSADQNAQHLQSLESPKNIAQSFRNTNGWAVGFSAKAAVDRAIREATERHLLLLTFIKDGWSGFQEINRVQLDGVELISLISKYTLAGFAAGVAIAKSKKFPGVSFGYLCDKIESIETSPKWEQAFYESYDYLRARSNLNKYQPQNDLISQNLDYFLTTQFDEPFGKANREPIQVKDSFQSNLSVIDLRKRWDLSFPMYSAVVHGKDLIPLFFKESLQVADEVQIKSVLKICDVFQEIPERHPIL